MSSNISTPSITGLYKGIGSLGSIENEQTSPKGGVSFADVLLKEPAKTFLETSRTTEAAVQQAALGKIDEQTLSEIVTEMDLQLQGFKSVLDKFLQVANELPRTSL